MNSFDPMDLKMRSGKTCPECSPLTITPLGVSFQDLSAAMRPSYQHQNQQPESQQNSGTGTSTLGSTPQSGLVSVWLQDQKDAWLGGSSTLNISDWPSDASVCSLSSILETGPIPSKYYLSAKACAGILRRAEKRGKALPELLRLALESVSAVGIVVDPSSKPPA
jgi:hypothetical protein